MKKYRGKVKIGSSDREVSVMARDKDHARTLLEQQGRLLSLPVLVAS